MASLWVRRPLFAGDADADELDSQGHAGGAQRGLRRGDHAGGQRRRRRQSARNPALVDATIDGGAGRETVPAVPVADQSGAVLHL